MAEQTQPTDPELRAWVQSLIADDDSVRTNDERDHMSFARAVLAKWGTPAGAGEPTEAMIDAGNRARLYREHGDLREEAVLSARTHNTKATWFAMCDAAPQPTQAQAGAATEREQSLIAALRYECSHSARNDMRMMEKYGHPWSKGIGVPETTIDGVIEGWHKAHGIKGADHG